MKVAATPEIRQFKLSQLNPAAYNPREISPASLGGLGKSIEKFGCVEPIIVNVRGGKNVIVGGHQRHKALVQLDDSDPQVDCVVVDLSKTEERLLNISLNNPEIQGVFSPDLQKQIEELQAECEGTTALLDLRIEELRQKDTPAEDCEIDITVQRNRTGVREGSGTKCNGAVTLPDSSPIEYRRATANDLAAIQRFVDGWLSGRMKSQGIRGAGNDYFVSPMQHKSYLRSCVVYLAISDAQIVGWAVKERSNVLIHLLVDGRHRGCGIGRRLLRILNPDVIRSKSDQTTGDPAGFYEKHGYMAFGQGKVGRKNNIDLMVKGKAEKTA